ncbi:error-prone DNA polymerase [Chitinophaga sp.]|uniref:error-prone DNA polymerase n=1 Tax=Chitinophaga sp. TaxID=1869181 RepID=UPI00260C78B1|nr:error-prone DNA polymerase [uncultured Chitinophaga sp.]
MEYAELQVTSNFSFLRGGSHPEELVQQAAMLQHAAIAVTDRNTLAGIVRAHSAAKECGIRFIPACRLDLEDGPSLLAYPTDKAAYGRMSALLSLGNLRTEKGSCLLRKQDVYAHSKGIRFVAVPPESLVQDFELDAAYKKHVTEYREAFGRGLYIGASRTYAQDDQKRIYRLHELAGYLGVPMVALNDVHYHCHERRQLQDILTCVREKCTIYDAGLRLHANAERYLKEPKEMERLFRQYPDAIRQTMDIAESCRFSLDSLQYIYPEEITSGGRTPQEELEMLTWKGAREYFGEELPEKIVQSIHHEMTFIREMDYAAYFLTVYDIVRYARENHILCQGRGSAANSTVCFCLGITSVNPTKFDLLFERFISSARNEPPDIDVDFEHERREEVMQYIYNKYGRDRAAIVATVTQQRQKGAIRDVGKAMGLSADTISRLSSAIWEFTDEWFDANALRQAGLNPEDPHLKKVLELTGQMMGFPRQLGQHTGGFVITRGKLTDLCPILNARMENRTNIEWNKDDIEALGFLKIDVLALGMLTCIRKAFTLAKEHYGLDLTLANIPQDDREVYEMISHADTIGVFQIESRAQQSMLPRLRPKKFYDLVIEVAIVRPGPIQGDMVHPYLRRRNGEEPVTYPSEELKEILGRTLGVPLFQEQAMKVAIVAAGFTPAEADQLRRSMATFKSHGLVSKFREKLVNGMVSRGYDADFAGRIFKQLEGFGSYGFPESHAASFAQLVYVSSWLKCFYPEVFAAALLNSMPMGFYQPAQIVSDARNHNVTVRPVDVNLSQWDNSLEEKTGKYRALRLGFRQIAGMRAEDAQILVDGRGAGYATISAMKNAGMTVAALERLADADAFRSMGMDRRRALWEVTALGDTPEALFAGQPSETSHEKQVELPFMSAPEHVVQDYAATSLSLKAHPVSFVRPQLTQLHILSAKGIAAAADGSEVKAAGLVLVRQRPGTAKGVCFITIEDETGVCNLVLFEKVFGKYRKEVLQSTLLMVEGKLQREGEVVHIIVERCHNLTKLIKNTIARSVDESLLLTVSRADEKSPYPSNTSKSGNTTPNPDMFVKSRDFH